jgi:hypothetical protein
MHVSLTAAARWVSRIAGSAAMVWVAALAVQVFHSTEHIPLVVPLPDEPTSSFMIVFYGSLRMVALRFAGRGL